MTPAGPVGGARAVAAGLPGSPGDPSGGSPGGDLFALVLQMLGGTGSGAAGASATVPGDATVGSPAAQGPGGGGESATGPGDEAVASSPPTGRPGTGGASATGPDDETVATSPPDPAVLAALALGQVPPAIVHALGPAGPGATDGRPVPTVDATAAKAGPTAGPAPAHPPASTDPQPEPLTGPPAGTTPPATLATSAVAAPTSAVAVEAPADPAPAPVTHQVVDEIVRVAGSGPGPRRVTVRLQPEALGEVRVVMTVRDGTLRVSLAAAGSAHHALLEGAPELRRLLEAAGSPDARIFVRDLPAGPAGVAAASAPTPGTGLGTTPDHGRPDTHQPGTHQPGTHQPGNGQPGAHQPGSGQPDRRTPLHGRTTATDGIHDPADPPRRTESVTRTRSAGVDVTM